MLLSTMLVILLLFAAGMVMAVFSLKTSAVESSETGVGVLFLIITMVIVYVPMLVFTVVLMRRRFNDMDLSGWLTLLILVPFLNLLVMPWLMIARGTAGHNRFGPMPTSNPTSITVLGSIMMALIVLSIVSAIAAPIYYDTKSYDSSAIEAP